jgi:hypothetical protein
MPSCSFQLLLLLLLLLLLAPLRPRPCQNKLSEMWCFFF